MTVSQDDAEVEELSEIYDVLKTDAKTIVDDLHGGVRMWREAAGANAAAAGFILILALTTLRYGPSGIEGAAVITAQLIIAAILLGLSVFGFRKYSRLARRYQGLFQRAEKLG